MGAELIPVSLLKIARGNKSQSQLAAELQVSPSVISRLEATEYADFKMAERYLAAVGTEMAKEIVEYYQNPWLCTERPPFTHSERNVLWEAEKALQLLETFEKSSKYDAILQDPLTKLKTRIKNETDFIRRTDHGIAFIGAIGDGKTTALSFATNLVTTNKAGEKQSVFPVGSGRTTVCEVAIKMAPTFGIAVDNLPEEEIRLLVTDLVNGLKTGKTGLATELDRVIRNMAQLQRSTKRARKPNEKSVIIDPLKELVDAEEDMDQVIAEVITRMKLEARTEQQMIFSDSPENSIDWLTENIAKVNYGQHLSFSVPQRITVLLPSKELRSTSYQLSVIDTKGVEGTTQRPDLKAQIEDPRTVVVLCTKFADAPGAAAVSILKEAVESGSDVIDAKRACLLVLPREGEALKIIDDSGSVPSDVEEGYAIRQVQIDQQLASDGLPSIPVSFFNVMSDNPTEAWDWLTSTIGELRAEKVARINRLIGAATDLTTNSDLAKTRQARQDIAATIKRAVERYRELPSSVKPAYINLVAEAKKTHQSSIAASVTRRGKWPNFHVPHILGVGVKMDANRRSRESVNGFTALINDLRDKYVQLPDIMQLLESLIDDIDEWRKDFLDMTARRATVTFSGYLESADGLWSDCANRWGTGVPGYRADISEIFEEHFTDNNEAQEASRKVDRSVARIWRESVIEPLDGAVNFEEE